MLIEINLFYIVVNFICSLIIGAMKSV